MTERTPLDELVEHYGPNGPGSRKPCPATMGDLIGSDMGSYGSVRCRICGAVSTTPPFLYTLKHRTILDTNDSLFKALWEEGSGPQDSYRRLLAGGSQGYQRRSLAEVALMLLGAIEDDIQFFHSHRGWAALIGKPRNVEASAWYDNWPDALAAALLAKMKSEASINQR